MKANLTGINPKKPLLFLTASLLLLMVGVLDFITGPDISLSIFYLIPIAVYAWGLKKNFGILGAVLGTVVWFQVETATNTKQISVFIHLWNAFNRLGIFLLPALFLKVIEQERLHARTDFLTGAINHRHFHELLEMETHRSARYNLTFTVAFVDADNFKTVNDTFGHVFGDEILKLIVGVMRASLRKTDIVARVGGDEFIVLLPETDQDAARTAIAHMYRSLTDGMLAKKCPITFSVGALTLTAPQLSSDQILNHVDKVMYLVKNGGKNNLRFEMFENKTDEKRPASIRPQS